MLVPYLININQDIERPNKTSLQEEKRPLPWNLSGETSVYILLFQVDPMLPMNKQVELYEMLMELLKAEEKCRNEVRDSQNEVNSHHMFSCIICSTFFKM